MASVTFSKSLTSLKY